MPKYLKHQSNRNRVYQNRTQSVHKRTSSYTYEKCKVLIISLLLFWHCYCLFQISKSIIMQSNTSPSRRSSGKLIAVFTSVFVLVILCSFIATRNIRGCSEGTVYSARDQNVKSTAHVNDMLFSLKSFILFE